MLFDFLLSAYALGESKGQVRALDPTALCSASRGLTGTEVTALGLAHKLCMLHHKVRLYTACSAEGQVVPGLAVYQIAHGPIDNAMADVAVAFHDAMPLRGWPAAHRLVWHQTVRPPHSELMAHEPVDAYISSTQVNADHLALMTPGKPWYIVPNGWDYGEYPDKQPLDEGRIFYHTSAERGLHVLLKAFPLIRKHVRKAHLVVYTRLETVINHHPHIWQQIQEALALPGMAIELHPEGASRNVVLAELAKAQVLAYPSEPEHPCEVMPVSLMEACALGVPVVTAPSDGFEHAFGNALDICKSPPSQHLEEFAAHVVLTLNDYHWRHDLGRRGKQWAKSHTFIKTAERFLWVIRKMRKEMSCEIP